MPKNILMIGPTGVGKTEIARRVATMINAPFLKVEATRFTEVGYVGHDVERIVHDLVDVSITKTYQEKLKEVESKTQKQVTERILNYVCQQLGRYRKRVTAKSQQTPSCTPKMAREKPQVSTAKATRRQLAELLCDNQLEDQLIEIEVSGERDKLGIGSSLEMELEEDSYLPRGLSENFRSNAGSQQKRKVTVKEARCILATEEANKLLDFDHLVEQAVEHAEQEAIVFTDEIDKLIGPKVEIGRDVSGEGVQRDLLPIIEGATVMTRYGPVKTDHTLFIAAGTFSRSKPSDLLPEFQGRFPLCVELSPLSQQDLARILAEPSNALIKQYQALLATEGVTLVFTEDGVQEIARLATLMNNQVENIGARRLHTIMEKVLEELSFTAPERRGERVVVDTAYVTHQAKNLVKDENSSRYLL
jgi:ATP-dependent HslUV protease ATP-binding subunit HslU